MGFRVWGIGLTATKGCESLGYAGDTTWEGLGTWISGYYGLPESANNVTSDRKKDSNNKSNVTGTYAV